MITTLESAVASLATLSVITSVVLPSLDTPETYTSVILPAYVVKPSKLRPMTSGER